MRQLADREQPAAIGPDRATARLGLGVDALGERQAPRAGIDSKRGQGAEAPLAGVKKAAIGCEAEVGGPGLAAEVRR